MVVCALANANFCEDRRIRLDPEASITQCVVGAQPIMAQWLGDNPGWKIMRWSCNYSQRRRTKV
jgi:hypothetical protein